GVGAEQARSEPGQVPFHTEATEVRHNLGYSQLQSESDHRHIVRVHQSGAQRNLAVKFLVIVLRLPILRPSLLQEQGRIVEQSGQGVALGLLKGGKEDDRLYQRPDGTLSVQSPVEPLEARVAS